MDINAIDHGTYTFFCDPRSDDNIEFIIGTLDGEKVHFPSDILAVIFQP